MFYLFLQTTPALLRAYTLTWFPEVSTSNLKTSLPVAGIYELWRIFFSLTSLGQAIFAFWHTDKKTEASCIFFSWLQRTVPRYFFAYGFFRQTMPKIFWFLNSWDISHVTKTPSTKSVEIQFQNWSPFVSEGMTTRESSMDELLALDFSVDFLRSGHTMSVLKTSANLNPVWFSSQCRPQSTQSAGPVRFLIFCSISIFLLASLLAGRRPRCNSGAK